ncbi:hypothetical protein FISHEDRAFT_59013 [Fistulina hepatica ATCC 64428]|uniref:Methyltransferase domain-containing protein n=1 Tax=Fistulina hepatica ATCC 64428 TaxID=1128425 RepID=A0A0D7AE80_9AGAR|nr:hypothetical protein FISHEDRAFT_59013 [Fistulina hepatica ATCC 64428]
MLSHDMKPVVFASVAALEPPSSTMKEAYILPQDDAERRRLDEQYVMFKHFLDRDTTVLPESINPEDLHCVLDVAAGSMAWSVDVASLPQIRPRLSPSTPLSKRIEIYASDITGAKFPPQDVIDALHIKTFLHDVTQPFPAALHAKFDLVNMRMLLYALSREGWIQALRNVRQILKPGGKLLMFEPNAAVFLPSDIDAAMQNHAEELPVRLDNSWVGALNNAFIENTRINGHLTNLSKELPALILSSGLTLSAQTTHHIPLGPLCRTVRGVHGRSMASEEGSTIRAFAAVVEAITAVALRDGHLRGIDGERVCGEEGRRRLVRELSCMFDEVGIFKVCLEVVAQRPLVSE